jgi:DNA-binding NtrC family response regulator
MQVLVIEDEEVLARAITRFLQKRGFTCDYVTSAAKGLEAHARLKPALTLLDYRLGSENGLEVLRRIRADDSEAQVVMMTGHGDISVAVDAMKAGARDFLTKPIPLSSIMSIAAEIIPQQYLAPVERRGAARILGRSSIVNDLRARLKRIGDAAGSCTGTPPSVLITGETGSGKELIARALHESGPRRHGPFVSVNCAALPGDLIESELFGHEEGAFTDAREAKTGLFEVANGGVLFLDEVSELPMSAQAKFLRALEERTIRPVGGTKERSVDVWVIAATNRDLAAQAQDGAFRSDLMFRLQVLWVEAPPLRDRGGDVLLLATFFAEATARKYGRSASGLTPEARARLVSHRWPGNVRELRNVVERASLDAGDGMIDAADVRFVTTMGGDPDDENSPATLRDVEVKTLRSALVQAGGNVSRAATLLGVSRDTLRYRMEKFGLRRQG